MASPAAGTWHATLTLNGAPAECGKLTREIAVRETKPAPPGATAGSLWPLRASWNRATENLFSAWIEKLFDAPLDKEPSWPALYNVLRDKSRNMLFNSLGLGEDEIPMALKPDCTDMVYYLRAYFAFKVGLPFGYSRCSRGKPPTCSQWFSIVQRHAGQARRAGGLVRALFAGGRRRRPIRRGAHAGERRQHRFLYRAADARARCARERSTPILTGTC